jgi:hypothetical protein
MRVSFTGTRKGMTTIQWQVFGDTLLELGARRIEEWHDGDCKGADDQAHRLVEKFRRNEFHPRTVGHPCNKPEWRAYNEFDLELPVLPPLTRNRAMVNVTDITFATPYEFSEVLRGSGTWSTIRYCRLKKQRHVIIYPDGTCEEHNYFGDIHLSGSGSWSDLDE